MNQAMTIYKSKWLDTKQTEDDRERLKKVCICLAEEFDVNGDKGFKFGDNSKLIFTNDNVQVSLF